VQNRRIDMLSTNRPGCSGVVPAKYKQSIGMSGWAERVHTSYYAMLEYQQACHIAPSLAMPSLHIVPLETSNDDPPAGYHTTYNSWSMLRF